MTLLLDGIVFSLQPHGGISVYFHELIKRLRRDAVPTLLTLDGTLRQAAPPGGSAVETLVRPARLLERYRNCRVPPGTSPAVFHSTYYRRPSQATPSLVTVHDFTYERFARGPRRWTHSAQKLAAIRAADAVMCVSQATMDDLMEFVGLRPGQQGHVLHNGVSESFRSQSVAAAGCPFALYVGQRGGYKNFALALRAMQHVPDLELVCVGGGAFTADEMSEAPGSVRQRLRHAGFVSDAQLNTLYNQAQCLVYPSRYEGFGIPVAEAMRAGCPVVSIDCKGVRETGGDALTIAEDEASAFALAIGLTAEASHRAEKVSRGHALAARYTWEANYQATRALHRKLAGVI